MNDDFLKDLPKYDVPPVVETVLGIQFATLPGFSAAHVGWFWSKYLDEDFPTVSQAAPLEEAHERFGEQRQWRLKGALQISAEVRPPRLQFASRDEERMVQIQDNRLHYNWRKREREYPSYERLLPAFQSTLGRYSEFCRETGIGDVLPNQWEVAYVNHIPRGELWTNGNDWAKLFPGFCIPSQEVELLCFESASALWHLVIGDKLGRLHIQLEHGRVGSPSGDEAIILTLTARGPVDLGQGQQLESGLALGHASIVRAFTQMTSPAAHKVWRRTR